MATHWPRTLPLLATTYILCVLVMYKLEWGFAVTDNHLHHLESKVSSGLTRRWLTRHFTNVETLTPSPKASLNTQRTATTTPNGLISREGYLKVTTKFGAEDAPDQDSTITIQPNVSISLDSHLVPADAGGGLISSMSLVGITNSMGLLFVTTASDQAYLSARLVGPYIVDVHLVPGMTIEAWQAVRDVDKIVSPLLRKYDDGNASMPYPRHFAAVVILPVQGDYELCVKSANLNRSRIFLLVGSAHPLIEKNEVLDERRIVLRAIGDAILRPSLAQTFVPSPLVFYNLSLDLRANLSRDSLSSMTVPSGNSSMSYLFSDGRKVDRACLSREFRATRVLMNATAASDKTSTFFSGPNNKSICLVGDSLTRTLYNEAVFVLRGDPTYERETFKNVQILSPMFRYYKAHFPKQVGHMLRLPSFLNECHTVFANTGLWAMSISNFKLNQPPLEIDKFGKALEDVFRAYHARQKKELPPGYKPGKTHWMSTLPCSSIGAPWFRNVSMEFRHEPIMSLWADHISKRLESIGLIGFDGYRYLHPIQELTFDYCHFSYPLTDAVVDAFLDEAFRDEFPWCISHVAR